MRYIKTSNHLLCSMGCQAHHYMQQVHSYWYIFVTVLLELPCTSIRAMNVLYSFTCSWTLFPELPCTAMCAHHIPLYGHEKTIHFKMLFLELPCRQHIDIIEHTYIKSPTSIHLDIYNQQLVLLYYWSKDLFDSLFLHLYHNILQEVMGVEMWLMCYRLNIAEELIQFHMSLAVLKLYVCCWFSFFLVIHAVIRRSVFHDLNTKFRGFNYISLNYSLNMYI